jgi:hypothetical protein
MIQQLIEIRNNILSAIEANDNILAKMAVNDLDTLLYKVTQEKKEENLNTKVINDHFSNLEVIMKRDTASRILSGLVIYGYGHTDKERVEKAIKLAEELFKQLK